jgi:uncharacterized membrane protein YfcA
MDGNDYLFILIAYIAAAAIKGLTGLGFSTACLPIMALHLDLTIAIPLVIIPSVVSNIAIMRQAGNFRSALSKFYPLYLSTIPGLFAGLFVLISINADAAKAILGLMLIMYSLWALTNMSFSLSPKWERTYFPDGPRQHHSRSDNCQPCRLGTQPSQRNFVPKAGALFPADHGINPYGTDFFVIPGGKTGP